MNRLDKFEEILNSYEGRGFKIPSRPLNIYEMRQKLSEGYEGLFRAGLLAGRFLADGGHEIFKVIVPEHTHKGKRTFLEDKDWEKALSRAESLGLDVVGSVFYEGKGNAYFSSTSLQTAENLRERYGLPDFSIALNNKDEYSVRTNGRLTTPRKE